MESLILKELMGWAGPVGISLVLAYVIAKKIIRDMQEDIDQLQKLFMEFKQYIYRRFEEIETRHYEYEKKMLEMMSEIKCNLIEIKERLKTVEKKTED